MDKSLNWKNFVFFVSLIVVIFVGVLLRFHFSSLPRHFGPDENVYAYRSMNISRLGRAGSVAMVRQYDQSKFMWNYPPPNRIGYYWAISGLMKIFHKYSAAVGQRLSLLCSILSLFVVLLIGLKFFNRWITLIALAFYSVSSVSVAMVGRALQSSFVEFFGLLLIYLFAENINSRGKLFWALSFILVGSYSILIKSTLLFYYAFLALGLLIYFVTIYLKRPRNERKEILIKIGIYVILGLIGAVASILTLGYWVGGLKQILLIAQHVKSQIPHNSYAIKYQSGSWYQMVLGFWILSPLMCVFFGLAGYKLFLEKAKQAFSSWFTRIYLWISVVVMIFLSVIVPYCQNMRYVSMIFGIYYLFGAFGLCFFVRVILEVFKNFKIKALVIFLVSLIIFTALCRDYMVYRSIFVYQGLYDPSIVNFNKFFLLTDGAK